ncbi:MAG: 3-hydroxyacyl-ACP dehydratase FabZ [Armatimonadetes bacterium]|nr:3-hydroxyacyl-ACP dehydratase FabZ [Armatimonadota bacterium]MBS1710786.1 3-hydroxyacyl-ACP dehydratase FabZ [Armatimonadota bacterium]MBX3108458.1 3-hydroxyacyl-ACP dehydratase FabZ [Fimbriimonadaceae bacterium]
MDIQEIMQHLPHRYPILLVDRIVEVEPRKRCVGIKNVTMNEPHFQGHYPGTPIMPGVLIIEAMAQAGAVILLSDPELSGLLPVIGGIDNVKFRRQVVPGDQLRMEIELVKFKGAVGKIHAVASVEGQTAAEMDMVFKLIPRG